MRVLLSILIFVSVIFGQSYFPMKVGLKWHYVIYAGEVTDTMSRYSYTMEFVSDTIVNNRTYYMQRTASTGDKIDTMMPEVSR